MSMMSVLEVFKRRRSVRGFVSKPIPEDIWEDILEAGRIAATSRGKQARRFVTITDPAIIAETVQEAKMQAFLRECSVLIVGCATETASSGADVIISMAQMEATAVAHCLGTLWLGQFDRDVIAHRINLPEGFKVVLMMAFGYAAGECQQAAKLPVNELFFENTF